MDAKAEITSYLAGKAADQFLEVFKHQVIDRWSRRRAVEFVRMFVVASAKESTSPEDFQAYLSTIMADDRKSEVLFDAYRTVCLSKAKIVGPRAIGLLTARIVGEDRLASEIEETWFQAFETLSDNELIEVENFVAKAFAKARSDADKDYTLKAGSLEIEWSSDVTEFKGDVDRTPLNLHEAMGSWAAKLERLGLLSTRMQEEVWDYKEDSERNIHEDGTARKLTYWISARADSEGYAALIAKAIPASEI